MLSSFFSCLGSRVIALGFYSPSAVLSTHFFFSSLQAQYVLISPEVSKWKTICCKKLKKKIHFKNRIITSGIILQEQSRFGSSVITVKSERKVRKIIAAVASLRLSHLHILVNTSHLTHLQKSKVLLHHELSSPLSHSLLIIKNIL